MEDRPPVRFCRGGDQQVGEGQGAVEARVESVALDFQGAGAVALEEAQGRPGGGGGFVWAWQEGATSSLLTVGLS